MLVVGSGLAVLPVVPSTRLGNGVGAMSLRVINVQDSPLTLFKFELGHSAKSNFGSGPRDSDRSASLWAVGTP